jgi:steroid 5-alpha reductase family enzyme
MIALLLIAEIVLAAVMAAGFLYQRRVNNAGWVDVFWTFGVGAVGVFVALYPLSGGMPHARQWLVAALVAIWSLRLGLYIVFRVNGSAQEDLRYVHFRKEWGADFQRKMFWFMQKQAWGSILFPLAIMLAAQYPAPGLRIADFIGIAILAISIFGEWTADRQLIAFKADPANKGKICDTGLWSLSRHPNYFFEWLNWVAYPVMAIDFTLAYPQGFLALLAPALMYYVVVHGTGIPPLEAHMLRTRGDAFRRYQERTRALVPFPKFGGGQ